MLWFLEELFGGSVSIWGRAVLWKGYIQAVFWLLPDAAPGYPIPSPLQFHIIIIEVRTQRLVGGRHPPWSRAEIFSFILCSRPGRRDRESTSTDLAPKSVGVGRSRLIIATVVRKNHRSILNWPPCDQIPWWIGTICTFYIQGNTHCSLNFQG